MIYATEQKEDPLMVLSKSGNKIRVYSFGVLSEIKTHFLSTSTSK